MLRSVRRRADDFAIIHFHIDLLPRPQFRDLAAKCVTTSHGRLDLPECSPLYTTNPEMPLVSIFDPHHGPLPAIPTGARRSHTARRSIFAPIIRRARTTPRSLVIGSRSNPRKSFSVKSATSESIYETTSTTSADFRSTSASVPIFATCSSCAVPIARSAAIRPQLAPIQTSNALCITDPDVPEFLDYLTIRR